MAEGLASGDLLRDERLRECSLIRLVVALAAVTIHVDHDVAAKLLAELEREFRRPVKLHGFLAVDVEDGCLDHFRDVRGIGRGAGVGRHRGEADLVIDDEVDRAAGAVSGELGKVEQLRDRALAGEGRITVDQDGEDALAVGGNAVIADHTLACAGFTFDNRVHRFKVAGICCEADADFAFRKFADALVAEVVFYIAIARDKAVFVFRCEFVKQSGEGFPHEIRQHVEAAAVRHAHLDFKHALLRAVFHDGVENDHRALAALQREALLAEELFRQEIFKSLRFKQPAQGVDLHLHRFLHTA